MEDFTMTIIGSGSALPMHGRHPSCQVLQYGKFLCLIDCGEGTQERLRTAGIKFFHIQTICISHLHGDHIFGLPGLLGTFSHLKRTEPLTIIGPPGIRGLLEAIMEYSVMPVLFPLSIIEYSPQCLQRILVVGNLEIHTFPLFHRIACNGYLFREVGTERRMNKQMIQAYSLTQREILRIKEGESLELQGQIIPAAQFYLDPLAPVSYAYCSDTRYHPRVLEAIRGVSVLYHETTFLDNLSAMAEATGHSTAAEAGKMACEAQVGCLITGHYSSRYADADVLVMEAGKYFKPVLRADEGQRYNLRKLSGHGQLS